MRDMTDTAELDGLLELLQRRTQTWSAAAWGLPGAAAATRADAIYAAVVALAGQGAAIEGVPVRPVPRLEDPDLPDQLAVMVHDLRRTADAQAIRSAEQTLRDLLAEVGIRV